MPAEKIFGSYDGKLSNAGESLELSMPGDIDTAGDRHYIRIDRVNYSDGSHPENCPGGIDLWPAEPDGSGKSLYAESTPPTTATIPTNWAASVPAPGE